ncbi:ABC transporter substrate-binding protein [Leifsonia bigeumensis]|uniref:ABC transporter substrate-binding protein n=1 Tax=Leifsonella bigeumensis TaxID=433643 RepID=A0ABP7F378_9MICO
MLHSRVIRTVAVAVAGLVAAVSLGACSSGGTDVQKEDGLDIVTMRHSWVPDQLTLPYEYAKAQGFYEDEGIQLVDQAGNGGATSVQLVANGEVMFGTGESSHLLSAQSKGINVVSVMQQYQEQPMAVITLKTSGIDSWEELEGKSIGGTVASSGTVGILAALSLKGIGEKDIDFVNLSPGAQYAALLEGDIDAAGTFIGNLAAFDFYDELNILPLSDAGYVAPSTTLFTSEEFLEKNPDLVERFVRATLRGMVATLEDPKAAAEAMASRIANVKAPALEATFLLDRQFVATAFTDENGLGIHNADSWAQQAEMLFELKQLDTKVDSTKNFTNEFVEATPIEERTYSSR